MTKKERLELEAEKKELLKQMEDIYSGILFNNQEFVSNYNADIVYSFDCVEFKELVEKYRLDEIAGTGSSFIKSKRLLHYLAPKLTHSSWYDNHIECNALKLLEYSLNNPEHGINCLNKSKILEECCLALGIYARRVGIMPFSPYDFDNHVVTEIYDEKLKKWIMLDPTTDGYFIDESKTPLSLLEIRDKFANNEFVTFINSNKRVMNLHKLREENLETNYYICKNLFYFSIDKESKFGPSSEQLLFCPINYSFINNRIANTKYRINSMPEEYKDWIKEYEKVLVNLEKTSEPLKANILGMKKRPY